MKKQKLTIVRQPNGARILTAEYPSIGKTFTVDLSKYAPSIQADACDHGFKQRFGDLESGKSPAEKYAMAQRLHECMLAGDWELTTTRDDSAIVLEAVSRLKKVALAKLEKIVEAKPDVVAEWRSNLQVKAEMAKIRAERAAKAADEADEEIEIPGLK